MDPEALSTPDHTFEAISGREQGIAEVVDENNVPVNKVCVALYASAVAIAACGWSSNSQESILEVSGTERWAYWQAERPRATALGAVRLEDASQLFGGYARVEYVINSRGEVEQLKILDAEPAGVWTEEIVRKMVSFEYKPIAQNPEKRPVKVRQKIEMRSSLP